MNTPDAPGLHGPEEEDDDYDSCSWDEDDELSKELHLPEDEDAALDEYEAEMEREP